MKPLRIGIVGIGNISRIYLENLGKYRSTEVVALADLDQSRAQKSATEFNIAHALSVDDLLNHSDVDLVLNLTIPAVHGELALKAVRAGKHVYNEKPLATDLELAKTLIQEAKAKNLRVGCAPDTFLGAGLQTARAAIDAGEIGDIVGVEGFMLSRGTEAWHPNPEFFYKPGAGPMLDMGPYYLTAMIHLLGGIKRTCGFTRISFPKRPIPATNTGFYNQPQFEKYKEGGYTIEVETPTHIAGVMEFESGAIGELTTSFDVYGEYSHHPITVYGSKGTMKVPDPNNFGGAGNTPESGVLIKRAGSNEFVHLEMKHGFNENSRGIGVLDISYAIAENRPNRASGDLALHVLETMMSFEKASTEGKYQLLTTSVERPAALSPDAFSNELPTTV